MNDPMINLSSEGNDTDAETHSTMSAAKSFNQHTFIILISPFLHARISVWPRIENGSLRYNYRIEGDDAAHVALEAQDMSLLRMTMNHIEDTLAKAYIISLNTYDTDQSE